MREYHSPEPIILSVGEEDEVSIADVARAVASKFYTDIVLLCLLSSVFCLCALPDVLLVNALSNPLKLVAVDSN